MSPFDHALEEIIPKNLLSEPPEVDSSIVRSEVPDDVPLPCDPVGQEVTQIVSHASLTLEGGLAREDMLVLDTADQSYPAPLGTAECALASDVAAKDNPAPEGGAEDDTAPKGARPGSFSTASMDVHVGSPLVQSEELVVTNLAAALVGPVTLEASDPDARNPLPADGAKASLSRALNIVHVDAPSTSSAPMLPALGVSLFLSNLQVSRLLLITVHVSKLVLSLIFEIAECPRFCVCPAEILWHSYPRPSFVFDAVEPSTASKADRRSEGLQPWLVSLQFPFFAIYCLSYLIYCALLYCFTSFDSAVLQCRGELYPEPG
jgi:hypothetical protein